MLNGRSKYIGAAVTVVLLGLIAWKIDLHEFAIALAGANYAWILPAVATTSLSYVLRTVRWGRILRPIRLLPFRVLFPVLTIGFMTNNLLPARMGELIRAFLLSRRTSIGGTVGLATILIERVFDGLTLIAVLGAVALTFPLPEGVRTAGLIASCIFVGMAVISLIVLASERRAVHVINAAMRPLPMAIQRKFEGKAESFLIGLGVLRRGHDVFAMVGWSLVIWSIELTTYLLVLRGVHPILTSGTPLLAALLLMVSVNLGTLIPSTPGYIGVFQFFGVLALRAFGVSDESALAVATLAHLVQWLPVTALGLTFAAREGVRLQSLRSLAEDLNPALELARAKE